VVAELHDAHHVEHHVDLSVPAAGEAVVLPIAGGHVDRGGPGPGREVAPVREAGDVADLDQEPARTGGSDAVQVDQPGAGAEPAMAEDVFVGLHHLDGDRPFARVHPDHDP
jgi:hypothetical protein